MKVNSVTKNRVCKTKSAYEWHESVVRLTSQCCEPISEGGYEVVLNRRDYYSHIIYYMEKRLQSVTYLVIFHGRGQDSGNFPNPIK